MRRNWASRDYLAGKRENLVGGEGSFLNVDKFLMGESKEDGARLFWAISTDRPRDNGKKVKYRKFHLTIRTVRVVKHWYGLPWETTDSPSLKTFKIQLDSVQSNLLQPQEGWSRQPPEVRSNLNYSVILTVCLHTKVKFDCTINVLAHCGKSTFFSHSKFSIFPGAMPCFWLRFQVETYWAFHLFTIWISKHTANSSIRADFYGNYSA